MVLFSLTNFFSESLKLAAPKKEWIFSGKNKWSNGVACLSITEPSVKSIPKLPHEFQFNSSWINVLNVLFLNDFGWLNCMLSLNDSTKTSFILVAQLS